MISEIPSAVEHLSADQFADTLSRLLRQKVGENMCLTLWERQLEVAPIRDDPDNRMGIYYGPSRYIHCYPPLEIDASTEGDMVRQAVKYLLDPDSIPPAISKMVQNIRQTLMGGGVPEYWITVSYPDGPNSPRISQNGQPERFIRIGLGSVTTINCFDEGKSQWLTDTEGGIRFLRGLWYNPGTWDDQYELGARGNFVKK